tara:strand:+ start:595 stop:1725 length:1131 start_codon:yes stop_codon:yes gene_type:complete
MKIGRNNHIIFFSILNIILFIILFYGGSRHDYSLYSITWQGVLNQDPNIYYHSYGPLHLFFAFIFNLNPLLPKIIYGILFSIFQIFLFLKLLKLEDKFLLLFYISIPCNFLIIATVYFYGINDSIVAFFLFFSLIFKLDKKDVLSGIFLSVSILTKIYPILLVPFFILERKKINIKLLFSLIVSLIVIMLISFYFFGNRLILDPFMFGAARDPKLLSILASLSYDFPESLIVKKLIENNSFIVLVSTLMTIIFCLIKQTRILVSLILTYLTILITYKVGHMQFYLPLCAFFSLLLIYEKKYLDIFYIVLPLIILLSFTQLIYSTTSGFDLMSQSEYNFEIIRQKIGYIFFTINIFVFYRIIKSVDKNKSIQIENLN